jgi:hypothetical protein
VVSGQPGLRSVDSESESHAIELRKSLVEAFSVPLLGAVSPRRDGESSAVPPESEEHGQTGDGGLAGTWEVLTVPRNQEAWGSRARAEDPWPVTRAFGVARSESRMWPWYCRAKETKRSGMAVRKS